MKKSLSMVVAFVFALTTFINAQESDKKSQEILKSASSKYNSLKSLKADFSILVEDPKTKSKDEKKGTLKIKGDKYRLEVAGQEIISDGKTRWTYLKDANEVQIDYQTEDPNAVTPKNIFTMYEKGWNSKYAGEATENGKAVHLIELAPVDPKKKNIFKVKLSVDKATNMVASAKMFDKNGTTQTLKVNKLEPDAAMDESNYTFSSSAHPGTEVVDLR